MGCDGRSAGADEWSDCADRAAACLAVHLVRLPLRSGVRLCLGVSAGRPAFRAGNARAARVGPGVARRDRQPRLASSDAVLRGRRGVSARLWGEPARTTGPAHLRQCARAGVRDADQSGELQPERYLRRERQDRENSEFSVHAESARWQHARRGKCGVPLSDHRPVRRRGVYRWRLRGPELSQHCRERPGGSDAGRRASLLLACGANPARSRVQSDLDAIAAGRNAGGNRAKRDHRGAWNDDGRRILASHTLVHTPGFFNALVLHISIGEAF